MYCAFGCILFCVVEILAIVPISRIEGFAMYSNTARPGSSAPYPNMLEIAVASAPRTGRRTISIPRRSETIWNAGEAIWTSRHISVQMSLALRSIFLAARPYLRVYLAKGTA